MSGSSATSSVSSATLTPTERALRHDTYYIPGGDVIFRVETYLFRVHRYFFTRESAYFRENLPHPTPPGEYAKGATDSNPFVLDDALSVDFARFLWVFYNPKYSIYGADVAEWTSILKLAHTWQFPEVKALAVRELELLTIPPITKIVIYHNYEIDRTLLIASYTALTTRDEPISLDEGKELGIETALQLAKAREIARGPKTPSGLRSPTPVNAGDQDLDSIIKDIFALAAAPSPPLKLTNPPQNGNGTANGAGARLAGRTPLQSTPTSLVMGMGMPTAPMAEPMASVVGSKPLQPPPPPVPLSYEVGRGMVGQVEGRVSVQAQAPMKQEAVSISQEESQPARPVIDTSKTVRDLAKAAKESDEGEKKGVAKGAGADTSRAGLSSASDMSHGTDDSKKEELIIVTENSKKIDVLSPRPPESAISKSPEHRLSNANARNHQSSSAQRGAGHQTKGSVSTPRSGLFGWASSLLGGGEEMTEDVENRGAEEAGLLSSPIPGGWGSAGRGGRRTGESSATRDHVAEEQARARADQERLERERVEQAAKEKAEQERLEAERLEKEAKEKVAAREREEAAAKAKEEKERLQVEREAKQEVQRKEKEEREAKQKAEKEEKERQQAEREAKREAKRKEKVEREAK
ncbi:hypothetical protein EW146_g1064, partial [Bondarzewia mesenterica]